MPPLSFSEIIITGIMELTDAMGTSFIKLILFFHNVSIINALFLPLREMLYAGRVKLC